jgi:hypothetical protein
MYDINIVTNYTNIQQFKKLSNFKLSLGKSFIDTQTKQFSIKDNFIAFQLLEYNRNIQKFGEAGKINFYYDLTIQHNNIEIYFDTIKFEKPLDNTINIEKWLKTILVEIKKNLKSSSS